MVVLAAIGLGTALLFVGGADLRRRTGLDFSVDGLASLRAWIRGLGWRGPLAFTLLVTFRGFLLIPSHLALILGGVALGAVGGTLWGALGLFVSALMQFGAARLLGDDWVQPRLAAGSRAIEERIRRFGPGPVWLLTAHPLGPQTPVNFGAGLVAMDLWKFALAVALAVPLRAAVYATLGTSVLDWDVRTSMGLALAFGVLFLLPMSIPSVRRRLVGTTSTS